VTHGLAPDLLWQEFGILQENPQITTRNYNLYQLVERKEKREIGRHGRVVSGLTRVQGRRDAQTRQTTRTQSSKYNYTGYVGVYHILHGVRSGFLPQHTAPSKASLDPSLKRHTALIKRAKQSIGLEHRDQLLKDIDVLTLERYLDEIATAVIEGVARCKNDKDVWSAIEVCPVPPRPPFAPTTQGSLTLGWPFVISRLFLPSIDASSQRSHRKSYRSYTRGFLLPRVSHPDLPRLFLLRYRSGRQRHGSRASARCCASVQSLLWLVSSVMRTQGGAAVSGS